MLSCEFCEIFRKHLRATAFENIIMLEFYLLFLHDAIFQSPVNICVFKVDVILVFLLLTLNIFHTFSSVPVVDFKQVNVSWVIPITSSRTKRSILKISENSKLTSLVEYMLSKNARLKSYLKWTPRWMLFVNFL